MIRASLAAALGIAAVSSTPAGQQDTAAPARVDVFVAGEGGYHTYRIPSAIVTPNGTLLAFAEGRRAGAGDAGDIDLVLRRSHDGGRSWTPTQVIGDNGPNTFGNPCAVVDTRTNTIWLLITQNRGTDREKDIIAGTSEGSRTVWAMRSQDDGATWSTPADITASVKAPDWTWYATGPGVGIQLRSGRLVAPGNHAEAKTGVPVRISSSATTGDRAGRPAQARIQARTKARSWSWPTAGCCSTCAITRRSLRTSG